MYQQKYSIIVNSFLNIFGFVLLSRSWTYNIFVKTIQILWSRTNKYSICLLFFVSVTLAFNFRSLLFKGILTLLSTFMEDPFVAVKRALLFFSWIFLNQTMFITYNINVSIYKLSSCGKCLHSAYTVLYLHWRLCSINVR